MSAYLVDTNVWSEAIRKSPSPQVIAWLRKHERNLYVSTISIGELKHGIDRLPSGKRKGAYQQWLKGLTERMQGRVLSFNTSVAIVWGQMLTRCEKNGISLPGIDSQIAATALRHSLELATRNVSDFQHTGVTIVNPFD